jgi:hypothetical protein
MPFEEFLGLKE